MPVDFNKELIFIHIPKTGGTSVTHALDLLDTNNFFSYQPTIISMSQIETYFESLEKNIVLSITPQHLSSCQLKSIVGDKYDIYTKFSIVRNPYDRIVSEYHYIKNLPNRKFEPFKNLSFLQFVRSVFDLPHMLQKSIFDNHLTPQNEFLTCFDSNDKIFKFEDISQVFDWLNCKYEHKKKSQRKHYTEYYCDSSYEIVSNIYKEDLSIFNYSF